MTATSNSDAGTGTFDYIWILRCSGQNESRNVECGMVPYAPRAGIKPLIEVVDGHVLRKLVTLLRNKYGKVMVDYPLYLLEFSSKFSESMSQLKNDYPDQEQFFRSFQRLIDIPVVSAQHVSVVDFVEENTVLMSLKKLFNIVAVRVRVPTYDLSAIPTILDSYKALPS